MNPNTRENFQRLIAAVKALPAIPTAVAHPCDESSLAAAKLGIIAPILVGPRKRILAAASAAKLDVSAYEVVEVEHSHAAAEKAVALEREGRDEMLMKGSLSTTEAAQKIQMTSIKNIEQFDSNLILQGVEGNRVWSIVIAKDTGKMSAPRLIIRRASSFSERAHRFDKEGGGGCQCLHQTNPLRGGQCSQFPLAGLRRVIRSIATNGRTTRISCKQETFRLYECVSGLL